MTGWNRCNRYKLSNVNILCEIDSSIVRQHLDNPAITHLQLKGQYIDGIAKEVTISISQAAGQRRPQLPLGDEQQAHRRT